MKRLIVLFSLLLGTATLTDGQTPIPPTPGVGGLRNLANLREGVKRLQAEGKAVFEKR